jgi:hypothetical protein
MCVQLLPLLSTLGTAYQLLCQVRHVDPSL